MCSECNRRKSDSFEDKYLVSGVADHTDEPVDLEFLEFVAQVAADSRAYQIEHGKLPDAATLAEWFEVEQVGRAEESFADDIASIVEFLSSERPEDWSDGLFRALRRRWGYEDGRIHSVSSVVSEYDISTDALLNAECELVHRLGYRVELSKNEKKKWLKS